MTNVQMGIFQLTVWDIRARFRPVKRVEHLISTEGTEAKNTEWYPPLQICTELNAALNAIMRPQKDYCNGHGSLLILLMFEYWKFKRNILCSTRFSGVERARMSHAVNWKIPISTIDDVTSTTWRRDMHKRWNAWQFIITVARLMW